MALIYERNAQSHTHKQAFSRLVAARIHFPCSVDATIARVAVAGEAWVPVVLLRVEVVMSGRELRVSIESGWHCSLNIAHGTASDGSGALNFNYCVPVVGIDATTQDAVFTQKVLQEVVLDREPYKCFYIILSSHSYRHGIDSSSRRVLKRGDTSTVWVLFFDWVKFWVVGEKVDFVVDVASVSVHPENVIIGSCGRGKNPSNAIHFDRDGLAGHLSQ